jgi:heme-degrading monooxygenase HmoA
VSLDRLRVFLYLRAEDEQRLVAAYDEIRFRVAAADGHISDQLLQSLDDPQQWVITSEWETAEHYARWASSHADDLAVPIVASSTDRRHMRYGVRRNTTGQDETAAAERGNR